MKIEAIRCKGCDDVIFSRSRHDFRWCSCGKTAADGGFDYVKVCFDPDTGFEHLEVELDVTLKQLYDDYNTGADKFGIIKLNDTSK